MTKWTKFSLPTIGNEKYEIIVKKSINRESECKNRFTLDKLNLKMKRTYMEKANVGLGNCLSSLI